MPHSWLIVVGVALLSGGVLGLAVHGLARSRQHWMLACLLSGGAYVVLSLKLEQLTPVDVLDGVRWGLLGLLLFSFVRYRRAS